ncbi:MAG: efflux RND transporter permease subunit [Planctomycetota bacterium]
MSYAAIRYLLDRPRRVLALALLLVLAGAYLAPRLEVAYLPEVAPATLIVTASLPGAGAPDVAERVAIPLERGLDELPHVASFSSTSAAGGAYRLSIALEPSADLTACLAAVQAHVAEVSPLLPPAVRAAGVRVASRAAEPLMVCAFVSKDNRITSATAAAVRVAEILRTLPGIAQVDVVGSNDVGYGAADAESAEVWLDPARMRANDLSPREVLEALGNYTSTPAVANRHWVDRIATTAPPEISPAPRDVLRFLPLRTTDDGRVVRLEHVAELPRTGRLAQSAPVVETADASIDDTSASTDDPRGADGSASATSDGRSQLGSQNDRVSRHDAQGARVTMNGAPAVAIVVWREPAANAVKLAHAAQAKIDRAMFGFDEAVSCTLAPDTSRAIVAAARLQGFLLVVTVTIVLVVTLLFSQSLWATLIVVFAVSVVLAGVALVLYFGGMSWNSVTAPAMIITVVLAAVDSYALVEKAKRGMAQDLLPPAEASAAAARELLGPLGIGSLGMVGVLLAALMLPGAGAALVAPFAVALAAGSALSALAAVTLAPVLTTLLLRPASEPPQGIAATLGRAIEYSESMHRVVALALAQRILVVVVLVAALVGLAVLGTILLPRDILPEDDLGRLTVTARLPVGLSVEEHDSVRGRLDQMLRTHILVEDVVGISDYAAGEAMPVERTASWFVVLRPWRERFPPGTRLPGLARSIESELRRSTLIDCQVEVAPPLPGLGGEGKLEGVLRDVGRLGPVRLERVADAVAQLAQAQRPLTGAVSELRATEPMELPEIDRAKARAMGVSGDEAEIALQLLRGPIPIATGGLVDTRSLRVGIDPRFSAGEYSLRRVGLRGNGGELVPLGAVVELHPGVGPLIVHRHDGTPAARLRADVAPGFSRDEAKAALEAVAARALPSAVDFRLTGLSQLDLFDVRPLVLLLCFVAAALYLLLVAYLESWLLPLALVISLPIALGGAVGILLMAGGELQLFTLVGLLALVGLACRIMLLVIGPARDRWIGGRSVVEAAMESASDDYRPVLMTGVVFVLVAIPLVLAHGPSAGGLRSIGLVLLGGIVTTSAQSVWLLPVLFVLSQATEDYLGRPREISLGGLWKSLELRDFLSDALWRLGSWRGRRKSTTHVVQTVTGSIAPERLRTTLSHEHVLIDLDGDAETPASDRYHADQVFRRMRDFLDRLRLNNGRALVDCTPAFMGRDPLLLRKLSQVSGVHILTNTGYTAAFEGRFLPTHVRYDTVDELALRWITEWKEGIDKTGIRPGFIKIGVSDAPLSAFEEKLVRAAARTHLETGLVISSNTPTGAAALEQLRILEEEGVAPTAWIWTHAQREPNTRLVLGAAETGAWVSVDEITPENVAQHAQLVKLLTNRRLLHRVLVSHNELGYQAGKELGGKIRGYDTIFKLFIPALFKAGLVVKQVEQLMVVNPMNAFTTRVRSRPPKVMMPGAPRASEPAAIDQGATSESSGANPTSKTMPNAKASSDTLVSVKPGVEQQTSAKPGPQQSDPAKASS